MKLYETDNEYILDILENEEDELFQKIHDSISDKLRFDFAKFVAIKDTILKLNNIK